MTPASAHHLLSSFRLRLFDDQQLEPGGTYEVTISALLGGLWAVFLIRDCGMRIFACALALWLASVPSIAQESFVVKDVRVFDGVRVAPRTSVLVRHGVIREVRPDLAAPRGVAVVEGSGKTLLPGLIDAHAHVHAFSDLAQALAFGVTTELDMFSSPDLIRAFAALEPSKKKTMADARFAGIAATAPGGHGTEYNFPIPTIRNPGDAQAFVDARLADGSDYLKIMQNAGGPGNAPTLTRETMAALIAAAHRRHTLAVVHIAFESAAREALEAGADGLAHTFMNPSGRGDFGALAAHQHAFVVPTLSVMTNACGTNTGEPLAVDPRVTPFLLPLSVRALNQVVRLPPGVTPPPCDAPGKIVSELRGAGVPILAGTDVGNSGIAHGASLHGELALLVKNGVSPSEALSAATSSVADAFRFRDRGRIAPGLRADLLLVDGDPTADISLTRHIVSVWKAGTRFDRERFRAQTARLDVPATPSRLGSGLVCDFEAPTILNKFGTPWRAFDGVEIRRTNGGAHESQGALLVTGSVEPSRPSALWPGIEFVPSGIARAPANLSSKRAVRFWARGDGLTYRLVLITETGRQEYPFQTTDGWQSFRFQWPPAPAFDADRLLYVILAAPARPGRFEFQVDDVAFD